MFLQLLQNRRSIRQFQDKHIEQDKLDYIVEAMLRSPSSRSLNPWEFIVVDEKETIASLSGAKVHGSTFLKNAAVAIVVCADPEKSDVWVEDCSIASLLIHLAADDIGLGSCWVQIRKRDHGEGGSASQYVKELLGIDAGLEVEAVVAIGYPAEEKSGHSKEKLLWERVSYNSYGKKEG